MIALSVLVAVTSIARGAEPAYEPTERYERRIIEGWTVHVSRAFAEPRHDLRDKVLELLRAQLFDIARVVPPESLVKLREVPIWVEVKDKQFPCMCYHPSPNWLRENGYNPEKAGGIEVCNAENFLSWSFQQPWMVLHELAHAYHDRVLGYDNPQVRAAYEAAVKAGTYEKVLHIDGQDVRAYALEDDREYFAECSEAFFGTNDFYPFVRAELTRADPEVNRLLRKLWHVPPETDRQPAATERTAKP